MTAGVPAFAADLGRHGDRPALVTAAGVLSYRELAERVEEVAQALGTGRRLVLVETAGDLDSVLGYLGALRAGHVVLLAARSDVEQIATLTARYDPDVVIGAEGVRQRRDGSHHRLHPELALLMPTSGSTGSPKLVRLSATALDANAAAIGAYLEITPDDRAALSLPLHYCYGLSVLNSNLLCGASVLLTDTSMIDPAFWSEVRRHRVTSLHGVPYTFELLDHVGFEQMTLPDLRFVTQAGGRLAPEQVARWAAVGQRAGWQLFVMYGQTEATARMAYLPPELATTSPGAIGVAIPGGSLAIDDGELVFRGPNVMLGYADGPADLALGRSVHELRTGDLGRLRADGLFEVLGRRSRFVKPFGIRTDLDALEQLLAAQGIHAACTGTDEQIAVAVLACRPEQVTRILTERLGLPAGAVAVTLVDELPRLANGKIDHPAVARAVAERSVVATTKPRLRRPRTVHEVFARTFPGQQLRDDASFVDMGGDSLTFIQVSTDIERVLGRLPEGWDHTPLGRLARMPAHRTGRATLETAVLLRALSVILVVGEHAHLWPIVGGAHLLLILSGWTFARFTLTPAAAAVPAPSLSRRILSSTARIAVPSAVWIAFRATLHNVRFIDVLLVGSLLPPLVRGYWYIDTLVQILLVMALLFATPLVRRLERLHPFGLPATVMVLALIGRLYPTAYGDWFSTDIYSTQVVFWMFVLGWMAYRARTTAQRWATVVAVLVLIPTFFGTDVGRSAIVVGGMLALLLLPRIELPRLIAEPLAAVATASLGIYLTHFGLLPLESIGVPAYVVLIVSLLVGVGSWWVLTTAVAYIKTVRADVGIPAIRAPRPILLELETS